MPTSPDLDIPCRVSVERTIEQLMAVCEGANPGMRKPITDRPEVQVVAQGNRFTAYCTTPNAARLSPVCDGQVLPGPAGARLVADIGPSLRPLGNIWAWFANGLWVWWRVGAGGWGVMLWASSFSIAWVALFWLRYWLRGDDYEGEVEAIHGFLVVFADMASQSAVA